MRRVLLILLMFVLPLQLVWAAAAVHCQHETGLDSGHFGHHQHDHEHAAVHPVGDGGDHTDDSQPGLDTDADCAGCLGHGSVAVISLPGLPAHAAAQGPAARPLARLPAPVPEDLLRPPRTPRA